MTVLQKVLRRVDSFQRGAPGVGFLFGVVRKFGDDRGGTLAALLAYYGFLSLFPLLLVAVTVLGYVLGGHPGLRSSLLNSAVAQFPIIGNQLTRNVSRPLTGNVAGLVIGVLGLLWGALGVAQAGQYAMAQVWNVPNDKRPGFLPRLARGAGFFGVLGLSAVVTPALSAVAGFGGHVPMVTHVAAPLVATVANVGLYLLAFRVLTPASVPTAALLPGAVVGGIGWEILQVAGGYLIGHQLRHSSQVYGMFGMVLGLIGWLYMGAQLGIYAAEVNVVRHRRLWPRSLVQPPLTDSDREVLVDLVEEEKRRPEVEVDVEVKERDLPEGAGRS
ncbi:MAG TPA: YihY/virulence factor BrkB family protein [Acidimicrobiales bacterium]|nr:YihY/virulence factor BrkB family protein [Acidimicrobiales bacterium]